MNKEYTINEELVYSTLSVPRPAMIIHGYDDLVIEDLKDDAFYDLYARRKMYLTK